MLVKLLYTGLILLTQCAEDRKLKVEDEKDIREYHKEHYAKEM